MGTYLTKFNRKHVHTDPKYGDCLYESVLMPLNPPTEPEIYTGRHLQLQMCMYMVENYSKVSEMLKFKLQADDISLVEYIHKHSVPEEWGEECMLMVIHAMWNINITLLNAAQLPKDPLTHYSTVQDWKQSHIFIIFNGNDHFTGTGSPFH